MGAKKISSADLAISYITKNPLLLVYGIGGILASWVVYRIYKDNPVVRSWQKEKERQEAEDHDRREASKKATITRAKARAIASQLFTAMDGPGTNFTRIKALLAPLSEADYQLVAEVFGKRSSTFMLGLASENLEAWLANDLSNSEMQELKMINPRLPI